LKALDLLRLAARRLSEVDIDGREAEILICSVASCSRTALYRDNPVVSSGQQRLLDSHLERRLRREPVAYILGRVPFLDLDISVCPAVLIPRPETEWMVAGITDRYRQAGGAPSLILDLGTGSGCIALGLARAFPEALVVATDVSAPALKIARENILRNDLEKRVHLLASTGLSAFASNNQFDLVVSNPPYVAEADRIYLAPDVRDYEPHGALFAGHDGLDFFRTVIPDLARVCTESARVFFEIGDGQGKAITEMARGEFNHGEVWRDFADRERVVALRLSS